MLQKQRQIRWSLLLQSTSQEGIRDGSDEASNVGVLEALPAPRSLGGMIALIIIILMMGTIHQRFIILSTLQTLSHLGLAALLYFSICPHYTDRRPETQKKLFKSVVELGFKPVRGSLQPVLLTYPLPSLSDPHLSPAAGGSL